MSDAAHSPSADSIDTDPARADALRLSMVPGIGPRMRQILLETFGSPTAVLDAAPAELRDVPRVGPKLVSLIVRAREQIDVQAELELCARHGVQLLSPDEAGYPRLLAEIPDPPGMLYVKGRIEPRDAVAIAIVGTRHASSYGQAQAERLAAALARAGLTIVSGLARGVDAHAHRGALAAGGRTLAVLGNGLGQIYPPEHKLLAAEVFRQGALISELAMQSQPQKGTFPQRNRIISGMSTGVLVIEADIQSGALITARHALEQGREVFAVPGRIDQRTSRGCHRLLRDGAVLVESADDVLEALGPLVEPAPNAAGQTIHKPAELLLNEIETTVLGAVPTNPTSVDDVISATGLPPHRVLATLSVLEIRRLIRRLDGNRLVRI